MINEEITAEHIPIVVPNFSTTPEVLYESIVEDVRKMYTCTLTNQQAHEAARNLIEYVKIAWEVAKREINKIDNNKVN